MNLLKCCTILSLFVVFSPFTLSKRHSRAQKDLARTIPTKKDETNDLSTILGKQTKNLSFNEATLAKNYYLKENHPEMVIKCGQRLLAVGGDQEVMRKTRLELADTFLEKRNYTEAEKYAQEYQKYYPGADEAKKASFIGIQANFLAKGNSDRDQEKTKVAIKLAEEFLTTYPDDTQYRKKVEEMLSNSYKTLLRSELNVIETQFNGYYYQQSEPALTAAEKRLAYIKEHLAPHVPSAENKLKELEKDLTNARNSLTNKQEKSQVAPLAINQLNSFSAVKDHFFEDNDAFFS